MVGKVTVSDLKKAFGDLETIRADQDKSLRPSRSLRRDRRSSRNANDPLNAVLPVVLEVLKTQIGEPPPLSMADEHFAGL